MRGDQMLGDENKKGFTQIPNQIHSNRTISNGAIRCWLYIDSKPPNWQFSSHRMTYEMPGCAKTIQGYLNELENLKLLKRTGNHNNLEYILFDASQGVKTSPEETTPSNKSQGVKTSPEEMSPEEMSPEETTPISNIEGSNTETSNIDVSNIDLKKNCISNEIQKEKETEITFETIFTFEEFWKLYKVLPYDKDQCEHEYSKIPEDDRRLIKERLPIYLENQFVNDQKYKFARNPLNYLTSKYWNAEQELIEQEPELSKDERLDKMARENGYYDY